MIRNDFVSNSSSSSYIVSLKKSYLNNFCINLCNRSNTNKDYPIENLKDNNLSILKYGLSNFRLMFLGELYLGECSYTISPNDNDPNAEDSYRYYLERYKKHQLGEYDDSRKIELLDGDVIKITYDKYTSSITIPIHNCEFPLNPSHIKGDSNDEYTKSLQDTLIEEIKEKCEDHYNGKDYYSIYNWATYIIDKVTIDVTEFLLKNGCKLRIDKDQLESYKKIIADGNIICYIDVYYSGNGSSYNRIYWNGDKDIMTDNNVRVLDVDFG